MEFRDLVQRAMDIREQYAPYEQATYGRPWTKKDISMGFVGDVGDLMKLVMPQSGVRKIPDVESQLAHELADCLWSLLVLSQMCGTDLEHAFLQTTEDLEQCFAEQHQA